MGCPCKSSNWNQIGFQIKIRKITWVIKLFQNLLLKYLRKKITFFSISAIGLQQDFQKLDWQNNSGHDHLTSAAIPFFKHIPPIILLLLCRWIETLPETHVIQFSICIYPIGCKLGHHDLH